LEIKEDILCFTELAIKAFIQCMEEKQDN